MPAVRSSTLNACTATDQSGIRSCTSATIQRSSCLAWMEQTFNETQRESRLSATLGTTRTCSCRNCISPCSRLTTRSLMKRGSPGQLTIACSKKRPGSCGGTTNGSFLTSFCLRSLDRRLRIRCFEKARNGFVPVPPDSFPLEFADAAYRYGHAQIRHRYQLNRQTDPVPLFPDLLGFRPVPREHLVDWTLFFDAPAARSAQRSKKIDGRLVRALIQLPVAVTGECEIDDYHSLAVRDLQRGQGVGLPSGEAVARHMGIVPLTEEQVGLASTGWRGETPLWYYVLREADACTGGHRLGPVGGRIVTEVLVGLIDADATSYRQGDQEWRPQKTLSELLAS